MSTMTHFKYQSSASSPERLDKVLMQALDGVDITRSQIKRLIEEGKVLVNKLAAKKAGHLLYDGEEVSITELLVNTAELLPYEQSLTVTYEDNDLLVIDKPAGLTMHPGAGNKDKTLLNALTARYQESDFFKSGERPGIVHRLDKNTTGLVVVAKNKHIQQALSQQFSEHSVGRVYKALCFCTPKAARVIRIKDEGIVTTRIGRDPHKPTAMTVLEEGGKEAVTGWKVLERMHYAALLELRLKTGRTHQIRVHMKYLGSPVLGDTLYGDFSALPETLKRKQVEFSRQALHAGYLEFTHPRTSERLSFKSPLPSDMQKLVQFFREYANS